jgi:transposase-like protein
MVDETVIRIDGQQYWLYATVNPNSNNPACTAVSDDNNGID